MIRFDATDFFDFQFCNRLLVGDDRKRFQKYIRKNLFFRLLCYPDQIFIHLFFRAHLKRSFQFDDPDSPIFFLIPVHHLADYFFCRFFVMSDRLCKFFQLHRASHCKQNCFYGCLQFFLLHSFSFLPVSPDMLLCSVISGNRSGSPRRFLPDKHGSCPSSSTPALPEMSPQYASCSSVFQEAYEN